METLTLQERLLRIQTELKAPKNQFNSFGKYNYRNLEGILEAVKPLLSKYDVNLIITDEVKEVAGIAFVDAKALLFSTEGEAKIEVRAQAGIDPTKKGMDISQTFGSSSSYARKYALNGLFLIDDTKDADATNTHGHDASASSTPKARLPKSGESFNKVKSYLSNGGSLDEVKKKYQVTREVEQLLNQ